ncbi:MAG TPA: outer membrane beta-barrel protein [Cyclobacteriaceae bacterium]
MKTRSIFFCTTFILISIALQAQNKVNNYIGFSAGVSTPSGNFSKTETGSLNNWNNKAGFAKTGFAIGVEGAYYFLPKLGLAGTLYYSNHGGFSKADAAKLGDSYTDAFGVDESTVKTSGSYSSVNVMLGPQFSFPINKLTVDVRALAGIIQSLSTPEMTVQLEDNTSTLLKQKSSTATASGWQVGAGLRYALTDKLGLMFRADYFNSDGIKIKNENRSNNAGRMVTKQPMSWMNASVGLVFLLESE